MLDDSHFYSRYRTTNFKNNGLACKVDGYNSFERPNLQKLLSDCSECLEGVNDFMDCAKRRMACLEAVLIPGKSSCRRDVSCQSWFKEKPKDFPCVFIRLKGL